MFRTEARILSRFANKPTAGYCRLRGPSASKSRTESDRLIPFDSQCETDRAIKRSTNCVASTAAGVVTAWDCPLLCRMHHFPCVETAAALLASAAPRRCAIHKPWRVQRTRVANMLSAASLFAQRVPHKKLRLNRDHSRLVHFSSAARSGGSTKPTSHVFRVAAPD